jgi:hypothetical protein
VLARLDQIEGVESSSANESTTLIRLSLRPGVDSRKVAEKVQRVLSQQIGDRVAVQLSGRATTAALQREEWRDKTRIVELAAAEMNPSEQGAPWLLAVLLLAWAAIGLGLLYWQYRRKLVGKV